LVDDKRELIDVSLCALLAGGHVLLEDVPGVGKTTFIKAFAKLLGHEMSRVQFTSDLLPSDIVGVEAWNPGSNSFEFHRGPIFAQVLLADELNRASPRTQSALLEAMGESHVTIERRSYPLPAPFMVFASQNPSDSVGTFELPESQLDRFAARVRMGYPSGRRELDIFREARRDPLATLASGILPIEVLLRLQAHIDESHVSDRVAAYAKRVIDATRADRRLRLGVSTRGGVIWLRMAKALALVRGREHVIPDDLRDFAPACLSHRVLAGSPREAEDVIRELTQKIEPV
jgi:MoxR-like ATPase